MDTESIKANDTRQREQALVNATFARLDPLALAAAFAAAFAIALFAATAALLIKGAPPGYAIGPHLALLSAYLPGYSVSWLGGVIGMIYSGLIGVVIGAAVAALWNISHRMYLVLIAMRLRLFEE